MANSSKSWLEMQKQGWEKLWANLHAVINKNIVRIPSHATNQNDERLWLLQGCGRGKALRHLNLGSESSNNEGFVTASFRVWKESRKPWTVFLIAEEKEWKRPSQLCTQKVKRDSRSLRGLVFKRCSNEVCQKKKKALQHLTGQYGKRPVLPDGCFFNIISK